MKWLPHDLPALSVSSQVSTLRPCCKKFWTGLVNTSASPCAFNGNWIRNPLEWVTSLKNSDFCLKKPPRSSLLKVAVGIQFQATLRRVRVGLCPPPGKPGKGSPMLLNVSFGNTNTSRLNALSKLCSELASRSIRNPQISSSLPAGLLNLK